MHDGVSEVTTFFFLKEPATPEIYPLPLRDALPIYHPLRPVVGAGPRGRRPPRPPAAHTRAAQASRRARLQSLDRLILRRDRKSTRLNSSHANISYAVFCLKKKNITLFTFIIHRFVY